GNPNACRCSTMTSTTAMARRPSSAGKYPCFSSAGVVVTTEWERARRPILAATASTVPDRPVVADVGGEGVLALDLVGAVRHRRAVDLAEPLEAVAVLAQHVEHRAALVGDAAQRRHPQALDLAQRPTSCTALVRHSSMMPSMASAIGVVASNPSVASRDASTR